MIKSNVIKHIPNSLSISRIIASVFLLFFFDNLKIFIPLYLYAGITDVLDGFIARKYKVQSTLGARLDSIGDACFYLILLSYLFIVWKTIFVSYIYMIIAIVIIKFLNILIGFIKSNKLIMLHTIANKIAGLLIYFIPICLWLNILVSIPIIIGFALFAAIEEFLIISTTKKGKINLNCRSIFIK